MKNIITIIIGIGVIILIIVFWNPLMNKIKGNSSILIDYDYLGSIEGDNNEDINFWVINTNNISSIIEKHKKECLIEVNSRDLNNQIDNIRLTRRDINNLSNLITKYKINKNRDFGFEYNRGNWSMGVKYMGLFNPRGYIRIKDKTYYFDSERMIDIEGYLKEGKEELKNNKKGE